MGERLLSLDEEHDMLEAFACFDDGDKGYVMVDEVRPVLKEMGDRMTDEEVRVTANSQLGTKLTPDRPSVLRPLHGPPRSLQLRRMGQGAPCQRR